MYRVSDAVKNKNGLYHVTFQLIYVFKAASVLICFLVANFSMSTILGVSLYFPFINFNCILPLHDRKTIVFVYSNGTCHQCAGYLQHHKMVIILASLLNAFERWHRWGWKSQYQTSVVSIISLTGYWPIHAAFVHQTSVRVQMKVNSLKLIDESLGLTYLRQ